MSEERLRIIDYINQGNELDVALACYDLQFPLMLRGPTGIGKTTLVAYLSRILNMTLVEKLCTEDTIASDIIGRNLPSGWIDGTATKSLRYKNGAICYLDELGEARTDVMTVVHSLTDDRRFLDVEGHNEILYATERWMFVSSYNPNYQIQNKVKPSTAQRFITLDINYPKPEIEETIVKNFLGGTNNGNLKDYNNVNFRKIKSYEKELEVVPVKDLIKLSNDFRRVAKSSDSFGLREGPGTRLVARTAKLIQYGLPELLSIEVGMINPLTHDKDQKEQMFDITRKLFR
jgi:nitric oxide reductase NorQ protein